RYNIDGGEGHCIPDVNFRNYITNSLGINIVHDTENYTDAGKTYYRPDAATKTAMSQKKQIIMDYSSNNPQNLVSNTEGIQYFTGLTALMMSGAPSPYFQNFLSIDLSKNTNLAQINLSYGSLTSVSKLPKAGRVSSLWLDANLIPANTSDTRHDLRGVMDPGRGANNIVLVGRQGSRSNSNANAFYFRMNSNELTESNWTTMLKGGPVNSTTIGGDGQNKNVFLWHQ
ncbi:MAG: hypothetical protein ACRC3G_01885, partial [Bacteroidales bacterium]